MATKITMLAVPSDLKYDHEEMLEGGAQFCRFDTLSELKKYWANQHGTMHYACVGTGSVDPARFLAHHEWIFSPTKKALISSVVRWDEFRITPRWYDAMSDERSVGLQFQKRRESRRNLQIALGKWSPQDESAYAANCGPGGRTTRKGFWRLDGLPCGLTHFDWFSEHAQMLINPDMPRAQVADLMLQLTYDDWEKHSTLGDVQVMNTIGMDAEIVYWQRERDEGRDPYED